MNLCEFNAFTNTRLIMKIGKQGQLTLDINYLMESKHAKTRKSYF